MTVLESHYLAGGAAHSFDVQGYSFDAGPSFFAGLSGATAGLRQPVHCSCPLHLLGCGSLCAHRSEAARLASKHALAVRLQGSLRSVITWLAQAFPAVLAGCSGTANRLMSACTV